MYKRQGNLSYHLKSRPVWNGSVGSGFIFIGNEFKPCKNEKIEAFDGAGKKHCFNMSPQVVMIGAIK